MAGDTRIRWRNQHDASQSLVRSCTLKSASSIGEGLDGFRLVSAREFSTDPMRVPQQ